jgi:hypothetical protein
MSTQVEDRIDVGTCDLGHVFLYHTAGADAATGAPANHAWMLKAGNRTVGTYDTEARANEVALALCGIDGLSPRLEVMQPSEDPTEAEDATELAETDEGDATETGDATESAEPQTDDDATEAAEDV